MFEDDRLDEILGKGWLGIDAPSALTCPKCSTAKLRFHIDAHNRVMYGNYFPAIGELVDGRIQKNGDIDIPWFTLKAANVNHNTPADLTPGQRITWRVKSITTAEPTDPVQSMFYRKVVTLLELEYVGVLPDNRR